MCYATGAVAVGSGSYVTWYFRETIVEAFADDSNNTQAQNVKNPSTNNNIDKKFYDTLKTTQEQQENISKTSEKIERSKEEKQILQQLIESLNKEAEDIQSKLKTITALVEKSNQKITNIRQNKDKQDQKVEEALQSYKDQKTKVERIKTTLLDTVNNSVDSEQTALNESFDEKSKKIKELEAHLVEIANADTVIKQAQVLIDQLTKQQEYKSGKIDVHLSTKTSKEDEKTSIKQKITQRIQELVAEKTTLDSSVNDLTSAITEAQKKSREAEQEIQKINNNKTFDNTQKNQQKKPHQDKKTAQDRIFIQKSSEKQTVERKVDENTQENRELTTLKSRVLPYTNITLTKSTIQNDIQFASEKIKNLNDEISMLTATISVLNSEKEDVVKKIDATKKIQAVADATKTELNKKTSTLEGNKETSEKNYNTKNLELVSAQSQQSDKQKELQKEEKNLNSEKTKHEQEELTQAQIDIELKTEEDNNKELNAKKVVIETAAIKNEKCRKEEAENISTKEQEIKSEEKDFETQQGSMAQP